MVTRDPGSCFVAPPSSVYGFHFMIQNGCSSSNHHSLHSNQQDERLGWKRVCTSTHLNHWEITWWHFPFHHIGQSLVPGSYSSETENKNYSIKKKKEIYFLFWVALCPATMSELHHFVKNGRTKISYSYLTLFKFRALSGQERSWSSLNKIMAPSLKIIWMRQHPSVFDT